MGVIQCPGPVKIGKWCADIQKQTFSNKEKVWFVSRLIDLAKNLEPFEIPLKCLNIYNLYPIIKDSIEWIGHIKQVLDADLTYPIILDVEGYIMDGRHRVAKALLEERETIWAVRFETMPEYDYIDSSYKE